MVECFNSPAASYYGPECQLVVDMLARYLAVVNSSINFIIYCVAGKQFRNVSSTPLHLRTETTFQNLAEVRVGPIFQKLTHFYLLQDITVITRATACITETLIVRRLSSIEEDRMVETLDICGDALERVNNLCT